MTEALRVGARMKVLEIGTGSGYQQRSSPSWRAASTLSSASAPVEGKPSAGCSSADLQRGLRHQRRKARAGRRGALRPHSSSRAAAEERPQALIDSSPGRAS